jgi:hypothetical protein
MQFTIPNAQVLAELTSAIPKDIRERAASILLINSLAEGFGNAASDIDFMIVDRANPDDSWGQYFLDGRRFDCYTVAESKVLAHLKAERHRVVSVSEVDFIHKLKRAIPLTGRDYWLHVTSQCDWCIFDRALVNIYRDQSQFQIEDLSGNLGEEDWVSAVLMTKTLAATSFDCLLASLGESQPRPKWRMKKARRALGNQSYITDRYIEIEYGPGQRSCAVKDWIDSSLDFIRMAQMFAFFPNTFRVFGSLGEPPVRANLYSVPAMSLCTRQKDGFVFHCPTPSSKITEKMALVWYLAPFASDKARLLELVNTCNESKTFGSSYSDTNIEKAVTTLTTMGLLQGSRSDSIAADPDDIEPLPSTSA